MSPVLGGRASVDAASTVVPAISAPVRRLPRLTPNLRLGTARNRRGGFFRAACFLNPQTDKKTAEPPDAVHQGRPNSERQKMFAVIKTGGKQYRVAANDLLKIEKVEANVGDIVEIGHVLAHGEGENVTFGAPFVDGASGHRRSRRAGQEPHPSSLSRSAAGRIRAARSAIASF